MNKEKYSLLENYMLSCMQDSAHDKAHVYRVLYSATEIAAAEENVDMDILIAACLLHDIARSEQFADPNVCHARAGAVKASEFLLANGFDNEFAYKVAHCIKTHRFRNDDPPTSIEAKILFDADKLDVTGATGIARTLLYAGEMSEVLYSLDENGMVSDGEHDTEPSFFHEYHFKLKRLYERFYTKKGRELAESRRQAAANFYEDMLREVRYAYVDGKKELEKYVNT